MDNINILVVEDEPAIRNLIITTVESQNYGYIYAENGKEAINLILSKSPDIVLLDLGLPDLDGIDIIKKVRGWSNVPIIVISARTEDSDKIQALDAGVDDYLTKPFSVDELLARLRVIIRRINYINNNAVVEDTSFVNGELKIDYVSRFVELNGEELHLTPIEYKLICVLAKNVGKVFTHTYITKEIWGTTWESDVASLRVYMATLRKKIEKDTSKPDYIQTHVGIGYRMMRV